MNATTNGRLTAAEAIRSVLAGACGEVSVEPLAALAADPIADSLPVVMHFDRGECVYDSLGRVQWWTAAAARRGEDIRNVRVSPGYRDRWEAAAAWLTEGSQP